MAAPDARDRTPEPAAPAGEPAGPAPQRRGKHQVRLASGVLTGLFTLAIFYTLYFASALFIPITLALLLNLLLAPAVRALKRHLRLPESVGAAALLILFLMTVAVGFYGLWGPATRWLAELPIAVSEVESKLEMLRQPVEEVQEAAQKVADLADAEAAGGEEPVAVALEGTSLTQMFVGGAITLAAGLIIMVALLFFLLASGETLLRQAVSIAPGLREKKQVVEIVRDIEEDISYYLLTVSIINAGLGCAVGTAMYLTGMPNPVLWGVMAGLLNFMPFLGAVVGIGIVGLVALLTFESAYFLLPPASYFVLTTLEAQFVTPALLARRLTLNPVAVFLALIVWTWLWGIAGALLAVPLLAAFKICCDHIDQLKPVGTLLGR